MILLKRNILSFGLLLACFFVGLTSCKSESETKTEELIANIENYSLNVSKANSIEEMHELAEKWIKPIEEMSNNQTELNSDCKAKISEALYFSLCSVIRRVFELTDKEKLKDKKLIDYLNKELRNRSEKLVEECSTIGQVAKKIAGENELQSVGPQTTQNKVS